MFLNAKQKDDLTFGTYILCALTVFAAVISVGIKLAENSFLPWKYHILFCFIPILVIISFIILFKLLFFILSFLVYGIGEGK